MNKISENLSFGILFLLLAVAFGIAGTEDYNQQMIEAMPKEAYHEIIEKLGYGCSNGDIVAEYEKNRVYYDSITNYYEATE